MANRAILDGKEERDRMRSVRSPACATCDHWDVGEQVCEAFPDGIPDSIFLYGNPHTESVPGDQGIRFEPRKI